MEYDKFKSEKHQGRAEDQDFINKPIKQYYKTFDKRNVNMSRLQPSFSQSKILAKDNIDDQNEGYFPKSLKIFFKRRMDEIVPFFTNEIDPNNQSVFMLSKSSDLQTDQLISNQKYESVRYFLELTCKKFLFLLIKERPKHVIMHNMNLYNFDRAVTKMVEFYKKEEVEQSITNLKKDIRGNIKQMQAHFASTFVPR